MEQLFATLVMASMLIGIFGTIIIHITFAMAVHACAHRRMKNKQPVLLVAPEIWALTTLVFGLFGAAFYWAANESSMARA